MKLNQEGIDLIKSKESCRLKAYKCPAGVWTIGYGVTGEWVHEGLTITQDEADTMFLAEVAKYDAFVQRTCPKASANQHSACVSLAYNIGMGAFAKSSVARLHNAGKYAEAAQAFAMWNKGGGKVLAGLVSRRAEEAGLYLRGAPEETFQAEAEAPAATAQGENGLSKSRSMTGQGIALGGTALTAAAPVLSENSGMFQQIIDSLGPVAGYASWIGTAIVALTVAGLAYGMYARWSDRREGRA